MGLLVCCCRAQQQTTQISDSLDTKTTVAECVDLLWPSHSHNLRKSTVQQAMQQDDEELQLLDTVHVDSVVKHKAGLQPMAMLSGGTKGSTVKRATRRTTRRQGTHKRPAPSTPKPDAKHYQAPKPKPAPKDKHYSEAPPPKQYENDHDHYKQEPSSGPEQEGYSDPGPEGTTRRPMAGSKTLTTPEAAAWYLTRRQTYSSTAMSQKVSWSALTTLCSHSPKQPAVWQHYACCWRCEGTICPLSWSCAAV